MPPSNLDNLVKQGSLSIEPPDQVEFDGLVASGKNFLRDARNVQLTVESRFGLAYNAAYSFSLAALRRQGYRPGKTQRYVVFQALPFTLGNKDFAILSKCHDRRNRTTYEGLSVDEGITRALIEEAEDLSTRIDSVGFNPAEKG